MSSATLIALVVLFLIVFLALRYIRKEMKKGIKCVGCPFAENCTKYNNKTPE